METYDIVIIGGGPAGGQCARVLSKKGYKTLLVEQYASFADNNFSTAAMQLDPLADFQLPDDVIGSYWKDVIVVHSDDDYTWEGKKHHGVILDFAKLKKFLAEESISNGGKVLLGHKYLSKKSTDDGVICQLKNKTDNTLVSVFSKLVVDATGPNRKVIYDSKDQLPELETGVALEYLVEVDDESYQKMKESIRVLFGEKWSSIGYAWVAPMGSNKLKIGYGEIFKKGSKKKDANMKERIDKVINEYVKPEKYQVLDVHGGSYKFCPGLKDTYYKGKVIAIGDTVSTVNPLGGIGIEFALENATHASSYIDLYLNKEIKSFKKYRKSWRKKYFFKWYLSETLARRIYDRLNSPQIQKKLTKYHTKFSAEEIVDFLFYFKFRKVGLRILHSWMYKYILVSKKKW
jgi:flavin-dependent dehydrogenase